MRKLTRAKLKEYCRTPQRTPDYLKHKIDYLASLFKFQLQTTQQLFGYLISIGNTDESGQWGCQVLRLLKTFSVTTAESAVSRR